MHPILIQMGPLTIYTYGFFIALGILLAIMLARREADRVGLNPDKIMDLSFYLVLSGIIGSRLFYVATTPEMFLNDPIEIFRIWNGGLVFYGAFLAALVTCFVYLKKHKLPGWKTADVCAPSVALAHVFGRLGCFFAGCCYGQTCDLPWAITFQHADSLARPLGVPLHPTQLYSSLNNLMIFGALVFIRPKIKIDGQLFWIYILLYGVTRSIIEEFRGDFRGTIVLDTFSVSQVIGWSMALLAIGMLFILYKRADAGFAKDA